MRTHAFTILQFINYTHLEFLRLLFGQLPPSLPLHPHRIPHLPLPLSFPLPLSHIFNIHERLVSIRPIIIILFYINILFDD